MKWFHQLPLLALFIGLRAAAQPGTSYTHHATSALPDGGEVVFRRAAAETSAAPALDWCFWHRRAGGVWVPVTPQADAPWRDDVGPQVGWEVLATQFRDHAHGVLWGVNSARLYATADSGRTWHYRATLEPEGIDQRLFEVGFASDQLGAAVAYETPLGRDSVPITRIGQALYTTKAAAATSSRWLVYVTADGGRTWERAGVPPQFGGRNLHLAFRADRWELADLADKVVLVSRNEGFLWEPLD